MTPYRVLKYVIAVIGTAGLFVLATVTPLAQSNQLPSPTTYVSDFAGVIDAQTRNRLEHLLAGLKEKSKLELYIAMVDDTGAQNISDFSQKLALDWNIGAKSSRSRSLLLVVSAASKTSFTQFSRAAQSQLPEGVLGEMSYRMRGPLNEGRFAEAIESGVQVFASALAQKFGFNAADLEISTVAVDNSAAPASESTQPVLVSTNAERTRPRLVADSQRGARSEPTPPDGAPRTQPTPEPTPGDTPSPEEARSETPAATVTPTETPTTETSEPARATKPTAKATTRVTKKPALTAEEEADELEEVELTFTLPLAQRPAKLKEFLDTHPESKARPRAKELLISTYAALGDQHLKNDNRAGGIEQMMRAIDEADAAISEQLFSGVISQIPMNLYLRGEKTAAFKAAQLVESKFGTDAKRLLAIAGFYLGIERGDEAIRLAESAVKLAPEMSEAHRTLALGLHISLRLDEAAAEYKRTLELDPASNVSRISLADLYRASGKTEQALALYNEQLAIDPKDRAARAGKVISLFELARHDEANTELEAALTQESRNLPLLSGAAYWLAARGAYDKAFDLARRAIAVEPRYTWAQIALAHSYLGLKQPLDAERAIRFARQYGKFPTLTYELANVLAAMGLYQEATEVLRESFEIKEGQIHTRLAGHLPASASDFLELLAPERRAGIFQKTPAGDPENAKRLKALLELHTAIGAEGEQINEQNAVAAAREFAAGADHMRAYRQLYAASRLVKSAIASPVVLELTANARKAAADALTVTQPALAVQADEFRDLRARAISAGSIPDVAEAPKNVLANILQGRIEEIEGWALFNDAKYPEAIAHLKQATEILPAGTPSWRSAHWRLGVGLEQTGQKEQALDHYITSYSSGESDPIRRALIEELYRKVHGSLEGFENRLAGLETTARAEPAPTPVATPETSATLETPAPAPDNKPPASEPAQPISEESLKNAAARRRSNVKITGRILDANKVAIANVVVVLISPSGSVLASTTDSDGNYSFTVAPTQKTYRVIPSKDGYTFTPLDRAFVGLMDDQRDVDFVGTGNN